MSNYLTAYPIAASLPATAYALRPMRIEREQPIHYEATAFIGDSRAGCERQIRRMECFDMLQKPVDRPLQGRWFLDVLDAEGDILDTYEVNAKGAKYMRRTLYSRREQ